MQKLVRDKYEISASFVRDKCEIIRVYNFEITTIFKPFFLSIYQKNLQKMAYTLVYVLFFSYLCTRK